jgi:hypothetical protein
VVGHNSKRFVYITERDSSSEDLVFESEMSRVMNINVA